MKTTKAKGIALPPVLIGIAHGDHPDEDEHEDEEHDDDDMDGEDASPEEHHQAKLDAVEEFISAVHSADKERALSALETVYELCEHEPDGDEDEDDEEEEEPEHDEEPDGTEAA